MYISSYSIFKQIGIYSLFTAKKGNTRKYNHGLYNLYKWLFYDIFTKSIPINHKM